VTSSLSSGKTTIFLFLRFVTLDPAVIVVLPCYSKKPRNFFFALRKQWAGLEHTEGHAPECLEQQERIIFRILLRHDCG
jgi:hypothetical protein